MKRTIACLLAVSMSLGMLSGCGSEKVSAAKGATASSAIFTGELEKGATIHVLENDTAISKGYLKELLDAFNEKYAEYDIKAVDANMDQYLDLAKDGPDGYGPDVLYQSNDMIMRYAEGKHILPLPVESMDCYDKISKEAWDAYKVSVDGSDYVCGIPVNVQSPMLYYRADLLPEDWKDAWDKDKNDIPDMIENWNDMYAFSKQRHEADATKYGYMKSIFDVYFSSGFLFSYGGYIFGDNGKNPADIGFAAGDASKGGKVLYQLASAMNEDCIDDTITTNAYSKLADGTYFATLSTPDTYTTFYDELVKEYKDQGKSDEDARKMADENLVMTIIPKLPESGDLTDESADYIDSKMMGGINGYAVSSYSAAPNASLAFVEFATDYDMIKKRNEMLGISPARKDVADEIGGNTELVYENMDKGNIVLMPSIKEVSQIWVPGQTFFANLAKDAFGEDGKREFTDDEAIKSGLDEMCDQIHDAIFTLK